MGFMTDKYKGVYKLLTPIDKTTNQFPRTLNGTFSDYDIYISCQNNIQIFHYGRGVLEAYIPSLGRGHNIVKAIYTEVTGNSTEGKSYDEIYSDKKLNEIITNIEDTDEEVLFRFKSDKMQMLEKYLKPKTSGADRSPFSSKNLPKGTYVIPEEDMLKYKEIASKLDRADSLKLGHWTKAYLGSLYKSKKKQEEMKDDMKRKLMKQREYIHYIGKWSDYIKYIDKEINNFNNNK